MEEKKRILGTVLIMTYKKTKNVEREFTKVQRKQESKEKNLKEWISYFKKSWWGKFEVEKCLEDVLKGYENNACCKSIVQNIRDLFKGYYIKESA